MTRQKWYGVVLPVAAIVMVIVMFAIDAEGFTWAIGGMSVAIVAVVGGLFPNDPSIKQE